VKETAEQIFLDALEAEHPERLIEEKVHFEEEVLNIEGERLEIKDEQLTYVIAAGKAAYPMAHALKKKMDPADNHMLCISPQEGLEEPWCVASSHPIPNEKSFKAANRLLKFVSAIPSGSAVLFAISGGASALLCKPAEGIRIEDLNEINESLLQSGASINEINAVRKHLSAIKGGQLLTYFKQDCTLVDLIISDVPGNKPEIIGSGPTTPDPSTFEDAREVLHRYGLWDQSPENVKEHIASGMGGKMPETIKPGKDPLLRHESFNIGSPEQFAQTMARVADIKGYTHYVAGEPFNKAVQDVAASVYRRIREATEKREKATALIFYGESTVNVKGQGKGGRNQELALLGAVLIDGMADLCWLSAGTDGIDGPTDAAGAIVDGHTIKEADRKGLDARDYIHRNDSYRFHEQMRTLLKTGHTGNNVTDVTLVLLGAHRTQED
jgi:glycerate-2-kinase